MILTLRGPEKYVTKIFTNEKEKWTNKGNNKHDAADSLFHNTRSHTQCTKFQNPSCSSS